MSEQYDYCRVEYSELTLETSNALGRKGWVYLTVENGNVIFKREKSTDTKGVIELSETPVMFELKDESFYIYDTKFIVVGNKTKEEIAVDLIKRDKDCSRVVISELEGNQFISRRVITREELTFEDESGLEEFRFVIKDSLGDQLSEKTVYLKSLAEAVNHALFLLNNPNFHEISIQKWIELETLYRHQETVTRKDLQNK